MARTHLQRVGSDLSLISGDDWAAPQHTGTFNNTDTRHYMGNGGTAAKIGTIFRNLLVPQGATIESAYLQFTAAGLNGGSPTITIKGVAQDTPTQPASNAASDAMTRTSASVSWSGIGTPAAAETITSPDISSIIQEIVNRAGFAGTLALFCETSSASGNYVRIYTADQSAVPTYAPRLIITWTDADANVITCDGSGTITIPAGWTSANVECWGAGGRGGIASFATARAGGGGGGAYAASVQSVTAGAAVVVQTADGRYGYTSEPNYGKSWYVSSSTVMAVAGTEGATQASDGASAGGAGGAASGCVGTTTRSGGPGASGQATTGGGGGGSATSSADGAAASSASGGTGEATGGTGTTTIGGVGASPGAGGAGGAAGYSYGNGGHGRVRLTKAVAGARKRSKMTLIGSL